jgi:aspartyl aminopeptidase
MLKNELLDLSKKFGNEILEGLNQSVTPFHAVDYCRKKLLSNGFIELNEKYLLIN